jgi:acyl-CoA dehydrogenase
MDLMNVIGVMCILGLIWAVAVYQFSIRTWTVTIGIALAILSLFGLLPFVVGLIFWVIYLLAALFANLPQYRQRYFIPPLLKILQKQMPAISMTEREAIEAGNTWWEKELFCGRPQWKSLLAMPKPTLTTEEEDFLDNQVEQLCSMLNDWQIVYKERNLPENVWAYLKKEKFFGLVIPKQYGGRGFSAIAHSTIIMKIATRSISTAVNTMVPNTLGPGELLLHYGTNEQKDYYLPRLAAGEEIPCFALTAPDAGSDAGSIPDTGIICRGVFEGNDMIGIRLNWDKRYITLAPIATLLGLAVHLYDPEHLLGDQVDVGITLCLIPTTHPGVEIGSRHSPLLLAFMNGPTRGKDVFIPLDWIIGGIEKAGRGWKMLMESLSAGRGISLPALSTASGKIAYRYTGAYAQVRRQFNLPIAAFEGIEEALGYIAGYTYMLEACRMFTAGAVDQHIKPATASAMAKYHMTELARHIVNHAMDIHGGHMIQMGPRNFLGFVHFAMPISITVEGANILTRNLIIFGQGAIRCHPYLLQEIALIASPERKVAELDNILLSHMGYFIGNLIRNLGYGFTGGKLIFSFVKNKRIKKYQKQLTRMSAALALLADTSLITLGGSLKRRERISARLGDIMSQLYIASAVLKYFYDHNQSDTDVEYVCWSLQTCLRKIQIAIDELRNNFPKRWIGTVLYWIIFPYGQAYQEPNDALHKNIVQSMLAPSDFRNRLTQYCYITNNENELDYRLEQALSNVVKIDPIWKKLHKAVQSGAIPSQYSFAQRILAAQETGLLNTEEGQILSEYEALREEIIKVNEFSFDLSDVIA